MIYNNDTDVGYITMIQTLHLKIMHHFLHVRQKLMMCLLMKQSYLHCNA